MLKKFYLLMDKAVEDGGGGGGADETPLKEEQQGIDSLKAQNAELLKRLEALETGRKQNSVGGGTPPKQDDEDLSSKARAALDKKASDNASSKEIEQAIEYNLKSKNWAQENKELLPKTIDSIFEEASKENFNSAIDKANAIKVGVVQEFFSIQENLDLLTERQKEALEDFKKLTKNEREQKVDGVFSNIFEPSFEMKRKLKRAEQVSKGFGDSDSTKENFKNKMKEISEKRYLKK